LRELVQTELLPVLDLHYSARLILGRAGRGISDEQLQAFADAMSGLLVNRYSEGLLHFKSSDQLEILPLKGKQSDKLTRVKTRIRLDSGSYAPVDYAFRKTEQGWKAFDVTVEGISYIITYRNQITPLVEKNGIDQVTADLAAGNVKLGDE
jgi:phospholipid transport system substrate-binding protein